MISITKKGQNIFVRTVLIMQVINKNSISIRTELINGKIKENRKFIGKGFL